MRIRSYLTRRWVKSGLGFIVLAVTFGIASQYVTKSGALCGALRFGAAGSLRLDELASVSHPMPELRKADGDSRTLHRERPRRNDLPMSKMRH